MSGTLAILNKVRERVVARDWRNHLVEGGFDEGPGCILQLLSQENLDLDNRVELYKALKVYGDSQILRWNDSPDRTSEDVIALLY